MTQEILIIWLSDSTKANIIQEHLSQKFDITSEYLQLITLKNKNDKKKLKKRLRKEVLKLAGCYANFHQSFIDPREIFHSHGFYNYLLRY